MAEIVLKDTRVLFGGHDISGNMNNVTVAISAELLDRTAFGSSWRKRVPGLRSADLSGTGFWTSTGVLSGTSQGVPDAVLFNKTASTVVMSVLSKSSAPGEVAHFGKMAAAEYSPAGAVGEILGFTFAAQGAGGEFVRGKTLYFGDMEESAGPTTAVSLGTKSTTLTLWAALHVLEVESSGDAIDISVLASSAANFGSETEMLSWTMADGDPGDAWIASTRIKSTKHQYYRTEMSTGGTFAGAVCAGIQ